MIQNTADHCSVHLRPLSHQFVFFPPIPSIAAHQNTRQHTIIPSHHPSPFSYPHTHSFSSSVQPFHNGMKRHGQQHEPQGQECEPRLSLPPSNSPTLQPLTITITTMGGSGYSGTVKGRCVSGSWIRSATSEEAVKSGKWQER